MYLKTHFIHIKALLCIILLKTLPELQDKSQEFLNKDYAWEHNCDGSGSSPFFADRVVGDGHRQHEEDVDEGGHGEAEHESGRRGNL